MWASRYRSGRSREWVKIKNPAAPAVKREAERRLVAMTVFVCGKPANTGSRLRK